MSGEGQIRLTAIQDQVEEKVRAQATRFKR